MRVAINGDTYELGARGVVYVVGNMGSFRIMQTEHGFKVYAPMGKVAEVEGGAAKICPYCGK